MFAFLNKDGVGKFVIPAGDKTAGLFPSCGGVARSDGEGDDTPSTVYDGSPPQRGGIWAE